MPKRRRKPTRWGLGCRTRSRAATSCTRPPAARRSPGLRRAADQYNSNAGVALRSGLYLFRALGSRAFRIVGAGLERAVPAAPLDQGLAAHRAGFVQELRTFARLS